ncbi:hypothetical protein ANCCAN_01970 [Ancylostoma caninum]|uniref:Uncharacterized protein n=1 Tax=Ancylostoma caninum TaxID=29170 RepID=A0A368H5L0_ANCCA|nr:hypothetical protein ANCCAN_01970 [Ancylostoma caninum]
MSKRCSERLPEQTGTNTVEIRRFMYPWTRRTETMPFSSNGSYCSLQFG